jgi:tyrosyl-tRNA synthetase
MTDKNTSARLKSEFLRQIIGRDYLHQCTDLEGLDARMSAGIVVTYNGFDPTGPSLHVGHLLPVMMLRLLQKSGHKPIVLLGGGTALVGDPSGKDAARQLLTEEDIARNIKSIRHVFGKYLKFGDGPTDAVMVNNNDWLSKLQYIPFLRDYGRHFSVNRMLGFDSVKLRLEREQPLSFLEFNYMVLQAYDFVELYRNYGCTLQMGGSDQWGNIVGGIDLGRRTDDAGLFGLTAPLITTSDGAKMGKTAQGAVWLNEDMLSPYDYWQFWRNTADADVGRFLRLFTELPLAEIERLEGLGGSGINEAKKILANEATGLCHGQKAAIAIAETARRTFEESSVGADLPTTEVPQGDLAKGLSLIDLLVTATLATSKGEARRLIRQGGIRVNDQLVSDELARLSDSDLSATGVIKISAGKKRHILVKPV